MVELNNGVRDRAMPIVVEIPLPDGTRLPIPMHDRPSLTAYLDCTPYTMSVFMNRPKDQNPLVPAGRMNNTFFFLQPDVDAWIKREQELREMEEANVEYVQL